MMGLAVGITAAILIFIYIQNQVNYDSLNEHFDRIYRLEADFFISEKNDLTTITQIPLGPTLKDEYLEIEEQTRILPDRDQYFEKGEDTFKEDSIMWADSTLFKAFSVPFILGDPESAINHGGMRITGKKVFRKYRWAEKDSMTAAAALSGTSELIPMSFWLKTPLPIWSWPSSLNSMINT